MENYKITPAPVSTMDELLDKIDMIHAAAKQWNESESGGDPVLAEALNVRVHELLDDIIAVRVDEKQWGILAAKFSEISSLFRNKIIATLNEAYDKN